MDILLLENWPMHFPLARLSQCSIKPENFRRQLPLMLEMKDWESKSYSIIAFSRAYFLKGLVFIELFSFSLRTFIECLSNVVETLVIEITV